MRGVANGDKRAKRDRIHCPDKHEKDGKSGACTLLPPLNMHRHENRSANTLKVMAVEISA